MRHVGRKTGRSYETPVVAVEHEGSVYIALPYGERTRQALNYDRLLGWAPEAVALPADSSLGDSPGALVLPISRRSW